MSKRKAEDPSQQGEQLNQQSADTLAAVALEARKTFGPQIDRMISTAPLYSFQEYLGYAAREGLKALEEGNYGIGVIYVVEYQGMQMLIAGRNQLASTQSTHPHAEEDAIDAFESLLRGEDTYADRIIAVRDAPAEKPSLTEPRCILVTSLEPCPGCARRIMTNRPNAVWIGAGDPPGGAMLEGREKGLAPVWQDMMEGIAVESPNHTDRSSELFVDPAYANLGWDLFFATKHAIDAQMKNGALIPMERVGELMERYSDRRIIPTP